MFRAKTDSALPAMDTPASAPVQMLADALEDIAKHLISQAFGLRIITAAVVAIEKHPPVCERVAGPVRESVGTAAVAECHQYGLVRDRAERKKCSRPRQNLEFLFKMNVAAPDFIGQGFVLGGQTFDRIRNAATTQRESVIH